MEKTQTAQPVRTVSTTSWEGRELAAINKALADGDLQYLIAMVESAQRHHLNETHPELTQRLLQATRFILLVRYGKPTQPRLAPALKGNTPIVLHNSLRFKRQRWL